MFFSTSRVIGLAVTVLTLAGSLFILRELGGDDSFDRLAALWGPTTLLLLFMLYASHFVAEPLRWLLYAGHPLVREAQGGAATTDRFVPAGVFACFNVTALLSYSLPLKLGLPIRLYLLSHTLRLGHGVIMRLMGVDAVLTLCCWAAIAILSLLMLPAVADLLLQQVDPLVVAVALTAAALLAAVLLWRKGRSLLAALQSTPPVLAVWVCASLFVDILLYGVRHAVLADLMHFDVAGYQVFMIGIVATFTGIVSTLPMGLGAYDATLVALLALFGIDVEAALLLAIANRLGMILTSIVLGLPSTLSLLRNGSDAPEH